MLLILQQAYTLTSNGLAFAAGREINVPDLQFQPIRPTEAITLKEAVETALRNYPSIAQKHFKLRASIANVALDARNLKCIQRDIGDRCTQFKVL